MIAINDSYLGTLPLTLEDKVLLLCSKPYLPKAEAELLKSILSNNKIDWYKLILRAKHYRCVPLLYWNLRDMTQDIVPVLTDLKGFYSFVGCRTAYSLNELGDILGHLRRTGTQVIVLKGAALAETVYPQIALRPFGDIDLLAQPKDWIQIKDTLALLDYQGQRNFASLGVNDVRGFSFPFRNIGFIRQNPHPLSIPIELHFHVHWKSEEEEVWERAIKAKIADTESLILCPEDFLVHLCIHLTHHNYTQLRWFADIDALLTVYRNQLNWEFLLTEYKGTGIGLSLYYTLKFTEQLLNCPIPEGFLSELRPPKYQSKLFELMWNKDKVLKLATKDRTHQTFRTAMLTIDRPIEKIKFIINGLLPPPRWIRSRYADSSRNVLFLYFKHLMDILQQRL